MVLILVCLWEEVNSGPFYSVILGIPSCFVVFLFVCLFVFFRAAHAAYGGSQARGPIGATAAGLYHSHSNAGSKPHLQPTPQLMATPDPQPTEWGQGSNLCPHGCYSQIHFLWAMAGAPVFCFCFFPQLKYSWFITLYLFQVSNTIQYFIDYIPFEVTTNQWLHLPVLCAGTLLLIYFIIT